MSENNENSKPVAAGSECSAGLGDKALEIMIAMAQGCAAGKSLTIAPDWGFGSGTLIDPETGAHTHFGGDWEEDEQKAFKLFVDGLHSMLCKGEGLSWVVA